MTPMTDLPARFEGTSAKLVSFGAPAPVRPAQPVPPRYAPATPAQPAPHKTVGTARVTVLQVVRNSADLDGTSMVLTATLGRVVTAAESRQLIADLDDVFAHGRESVAAAVADAEKSDADLLERVRRQIAVTAQYRGHLQDLAAALTARNESTTAAEAAVRQGADPSDAENAETAAIVKITQLKRRVSVVEGEVRSAESAVQSRLNAIGREVREQLRAAASADLARLNAEVVAFWSDRLHAITTARGVLAATTPDY